MRHLGSIVLSIVLAPIIYILGGIGLIRLSLNSASVLSGSGTNWTDVGIGAGAIVVAGALYAILVLTKLSPLGPVLVALIYILVQLAALFDASRVQSTFGNSVFGTPNAAEAPLTGLALLLAVPLLATIFSPRRWRGKDKPAAVGTYAPPVGQSTYAQPSMPQASVPQPAGASAPPYQPTQPAHLCRARDGPARVRRTRAHSGVRAARGADVHRTVGAGLPAADLRAAGLPAADLGGTRVHAPAAADSGPVDPAGAERAAVDRAAVGRRRAGRRAHVGDRAEVGWRVGTHHQRHK
jgi:hypothetical protein